MKRATLLTILALTACGGDDPIKPPVVLPTGGLLLEPASFCLSATAAEDTLYLHNRGEGPITWTPESVPAGSTNLSGAITIESGTTVGIVWTWPAPGALPAVDSLVARTTDPDVPRVVIPFRRVAADYEDIDPPPAPALFLPAEGAVFHPGDSFVIQWSLVSDCSGVADYQVQISASPTFSPLLLSQNIAATSGVIEVETGDADLGKAYWRVRARDGNGRPGPWSAVRSWTVVRVTSGFRFDRNRAALSRVNELGGPMAPGEED